MPTFDIQLLLVVSKICLMMTVSWCICLALGNRNPKGVVLLWRVQFVSLLLILAGMVFPPLWNIKTQRFSLARQDETPELRLDESNRIPLGTIPDPIESQLASHQEDRASLTYDVAMPDWALLEQVPMLSERPIDPSSDTVSQSIETANINNVLTTFSSYLPASESAIKNRARTLSDGLICLWLIGVGFGFCRLVIMYSWSRSMERTANPIQLESLSLPRCLRDMLVSGNVRIKTACCISSPSLIGILRPVVLLPSNLVEETKDASACHSAIAHELMHVKGHDILWHFLLQVQQAFLWPIPLVWWISRSHLFACERICDESASAVIRDREQYRSDLAKLALAALQSKTQAFSLSMVKQPEITQRLALLAMRPPFLRVSLLLKMALYGTIFVSVLLGAAGLSETAMTPTMPSAAFEDTTETVTAPKAIEPQVSPVIAASEATDGATAPPQSKIDSSQTYTVHSRLNLSIPKLPKSGPVNAGRIVGGRVTDADGTPISNATLLIDRFGWGDTPQPAQYRPNKVKITTDINGIWQWNQSSAPEALGLSITKDGFKPGSFSFDADKTTYDTKLERAISVKGTVVDEIGKPVQGARVFAAKSLQFLSYESDGGRQIDSPSHLSKNETDSLGVWQIGNWFEELICLIAVTKDGRCAILENANVRTEQVLQLQNAKTFTRRIVDSDRKPVAGASVRAQGWWRLQLPNENALTDANGEITLGSIPLADLNLLIEKPGYRTKRLDITAADDELAAIQLLRPQTISAQIVDDATGRLIPNCRVTCDLGRQFGSLATSEREPVVNGIASMISTSYKPNEVRIADGNLHITSDLEFRFLKLTIMADGYETLRSDPISDQEEQVVRKFRLKKANGISIVDVDGKPAANCFVLVNTKFTKIDIGSSILHEDTKRADQQGKFRIPPELPGQTPVIAWSKNGYAERTIAELESSKPWRLTPWASVTILDEEKQLNALGMPFCQSCPSNVEFLEKKAEKGGSGELEYPKLSPGLYLFPLGIWDGQPQKQTAAMQLDVTPSMQKQLKPLGRNRVRGRIDLATIGQEYLSEHSVSLSAICVEPQDGMAIIHNCEIGNTGEFTLDHLRIGSYVLQVFALRMEQGVNGLLPQRYPEIDCRFKFDAHENQVEKDLGQISCAFTVLDSKGKRIDTIGNIETVRESDHFQAEEPVRFVTLQNKGIHQNVLLWGQSGRELRSVSKKSGILVGPPPKLEFDQSKSHFFVSSTGELSTYNLFGSQISNASWKSKHQFGIAGFRGSDLVVYLPTEVSKILILDHASSTVKETIGPFKDCSQCKFSERDNVFWTLGQKLRSFNQLGKPVATIDLPGSNVAANQLCLDEINGGCWCISDEHGFNGKIPTLTRVDSKGLRRFSRNLPRSSSLSMVAVGGNCFVAELDRVVKYGPDGEIMGELTIEAKSLAATNDTKTIWAITKDGLCRIESSGEGMRIAEKIPGIRGDQLLVLE